MSIRWSHLSSDEKIIFDQYAYRMVALLGKRHPNIEREKQELHRLMDEFINLLEKKYSNLTA